MFSGMTNDKIGSRVFSVLHFCFLVERLFGELAVGACPTVGDFQEYIVAVFPDIIDGLLIFFVFGAIF